MVDPRPVVLDVPARPEYVRLARMLVASVAAGGRDLDAEWVDDLRLAVSEACTLAVGASRDGRLSVTCREETDGLVWWRCATPRSTPRATAWPSS